MFGAGAAIVYVGADPSPPPKMLVPNPGYPGYPRFKEALELKRFGYAGYYYAFVEPKMEVLAVY